jgi:hypothetical protein
MFVKSALLLIVAIPFTFVVATGMGSMSNTEGNARARKLSVDASTRLVDAKCNKQKEVSISDCQFTGYMNIVFSH